MDFKNLRFYHSNKNYSLHIAHFYHSLCLKGNPWHLGLLSDHLTELTRTDMSAIFCNCLLLSWESATVFSRLDSLKLSSVALTVCNCLKLQLSWKSVSVLTDCNCPYTQWLAPYQPLFLNKAFKTNIFFMSKHIDCCYEKLAFRQMKHDFRVLN